MTPKSTTLRPRSFEELIKTTGNVYETTAVISQKARQVALRTREELQAKLATLVINDAEHTEEHNNESERVEVSKHYEQQPKPTTVATEAFLAGAVGHRYTDKTAGYPTINEIAR